MLQTDVAAKKKYGILFLTQNDTKTLTIIEIKGEPKPTTGTTPSTTEKNIVNLLATTTVASGNFISP